MGFRAKLGKKGFPAQVFSRRSMFISVKVAFSEAVTGLLVFGVQFLAVERYIGSFIRTHSTVESEMYEIYMRSFLSMFDIIY